MPRSVSFAIDEALKAAAFFVGLQLRQLLQFLLQYSMLG